MENLPPLNTLRSFEAAARHLSFNAAAAELHVTPSAVSHAIKSLEDFLSVALFQRAGRGVALTADAKIFLTPVRDALAQLSRAAESLISRSDNHPLTISAAPALTIGWLMPRLAKFQLDHPDIEVRLSSSAELVDLHRSDIDLAIRSGTGHWSGLTSHFLMSEDLVPVCKPDLAGPAGQGPQAGQAALLKLEDLADVPLIHIMPSMGQWRSWLNAQGVQHPDPERGPKFESSAVAVEAAMAGLGVAIIPKSFVDEHIKAGRLVMPFEIEVFSHYDFYLVYPEEHAEIPRIAAFRDWVIGEISDRDRSSGN